MRKDLIYLIIYACSVTAISWRLSDTPTVRQMENMIYDHLQRCTTIDFDYEVFGSPYEQALKDLYLINVDSEIYDFSCGRVDKLQLALLLNTLAEKTSGNVIYLNYRFELEPGKEQVDSILHKAINDLGERLVLPVRIKPGDRPFRAPFSHQPPSAYLSEKANFGYVDVRRFKDRTITYRTMQVGKLTDSFRSVPIELYRLMYAKGRISALRQIPQVIELNHILRNSSHQQLRLATSSMIEAIPTVEAGQFIADDVKLPYEGGIIFIGAFAPLRHLGEQFSRQIPTSVADAQPEIYAVVNAYLNLATNSFLRYTPWTFVFMVNLLLAGLGLLYLKWIKPSSKLSKKYIRTPFEIIAAAALFYALIWVVFIFANAKFPFIITTIFFAANNYLFLRSKTLLKL